MGKGPLQLRPITQLATRSMSSGMGDPGHMGQYGQGGALVTNVSLCGGGWVCARAQEPAESVGEGSQWTPRQGMGSATASPTPLGLPLLCYPHAGKFSGLRWGVGAWIPSTPPACKKADLSPLASPTFFLVLGLSSGSVPLLLWVSHS